MSESLFTLPSDAYPIIVAFRGVGTEPAERLAAADPYGAVLYGSAALRGDQP